MVSALRDTYARQSSFQAKLTNVSADRITKPSTLSLLVMKDRKLFSWLGVAIVAAGIAVLEISSRDSVSMDGDLRPESGPVLDPEPSSPLVAAPVEIRSPPKDLEISPTQSLAQTDLEPEGAALEIQGRVVDETGQGISGMRVVRHLGSHDFSLVGHSGEGGVFIAQAIRKGDLLMAEGQGYVCIRAHRVEAQGPATILCQLGSSIHGVVLDEVGAPVDAALVVIAPSVEDMLRSASGESSSTLPSIEAWSNARGEFEVLVPGNGAGRTVRVYKGESRRLETEIPAPPPAFLELRFAPTEQSEASESDSIAGRVREQDGRGLAGWLVIAQAAGRPLAPIGSNSSCRSDSKGAFWIHGLRTGIYQIIAVDPRTVRSVSYADAKPGQSDIFLVPEPAAALGQVSGIALGLDGHPLQNVFVRAIPKGLYAAVEDLVGMPSATTNEAGRFAFSQALHPGIGLLFGGATIATTIRSVDDGMPGPDGVPVYSLDRLCPVRVSFPTGPSDIAVEFRNSEGEPLPLQVRTDNLRLQLSRLPKLGDDPVEVLVPESAVAFVSIRNNQPERVVPVVLDPHSRIELLVE